jgi:hypothetical protein
MKLYQDPIDAFECFRKAYKGAKRGRDTEFKTFQKHKDWREVVYTLLDSYLSQLEWREKATKAGMFVPSHANLQTWLNQRRWETELPEIEVKQEVEKIKPFIDPVKGYDTSKPGPGKEYNPVTGKFYYRADWTGERV